jgi:hypothetical protein
MTGKCDFGHLFKSNYICRHSEKLRQYCWWNARGSKRKRNLTERSQTDLRLPDSCRQIHLFSFCIYQAEVLCNFRFSLVLNSAAWKKNSCIILEILPVWTLLSQTEMLSDNCIIRSNTTRSGPIFQRKDPDSRDRMAGNVEIHIRASHFIPRAQSRYAFDNVIPTLLREGHRSIQCQNEELLTLRCIRSVSLLKVYWSCK